MQENQSKEDGKVRAVQDDLTSVLDRVKHADALIIGTPAYYGTESAPLVLY